MAIAEWHPDRAAGSDSTVADVTEAMRQAAMLYGKLDCTDFPTCGVDLNESQTFNICLIFVQSEV